MDKQTGLSRARMPPGDGDAWATDPGTAQQTSPVALTAEAAAGVVWTYHVAAQV